MTGLLAMNPLFLAGALAALVAALTSTAAFPVVTRIAVAIRAVDYPGGRRRQKEAIPRMGGFAIAIGIAAGVVLPGLVLWQQWAETVTRSQLSALALGTGLVFIIGAADDILRVAPVQRFIVQVAAATYVVHAGWGFAHLYVPFWGEVRLGLLADLITVLWIVGVTNAINLLDGLDGLAGGVAAIIASSLLVFAWIQGIAVTFILMAAIVGACLGFLRKNWAPAKIYMGDSGSLVLGFLLAVMSLFGSMKDTATVAILVPILALGLPVIDTLLVMAVRFIEKPQGSLVRRFARMFQADRNHVHHLMMRTVPGRKQIVLVIYLVAASFCTMALVVAVSRSASLGIALVIVEVLVVLLMRNLKMPVKARDLSVKQRRQIRSRVFFERAS
jgi:UDP-GlcNAc:undecaprenyl-phosphate GlcNAc-1-phosphate transferase